MGTKKRTQVVRVFTVSPLPWELDDDEIGLVLGDQVGVLNYDFVGTNGAVWDAGKFSNTKYEASGGLMNQAESYADIQSNKGHIKITKGATVGLCSVDNKAVLDLDFTGNKKYRIIVDLKATTASGTNTGNVGLSISPDDALVSYYPLTTTLTDGFSFFLNPEVSTLKSRVRVRKIVAGVMGLDGYVGKDGGYAALEADRLLLSESVFHNLVLEISTASIKVYIDETEYLDVVEDLTVLNTATCKLVLWGMNYDPNSLVCEHEFDNLAVEQI